MDKIVYVGSIGWANTASAIHIQNRAKLFSEMGLQVYAISDYPSDMNLLNDIPELKYDYMTPYKGSKKIQAIKWHIDQFVCVFSYWQITERLRKIKPDVVVLYEVNSIMLELALLKYCKKHNMKLVIETTEWMEPEKYNDFYTKLIVGQKDIQKKYIDKKCKNIIVISEFLEKHYKNQNCTVVHIPPVVSNLENNIPILRYQEQRCKAKVKFVFAGALSQKDFLETLLTVIVCLNEKEVQIAIDIIGPDKKAIQNMLAIDSLETVGIYCHGKLEHSVVLQYVKEADFSLLLRQNMRYAKAGVSTKFVEAMSLGVPSICTKVGGTDLFVKDGENGFLVNSNSEKDLKDKLEYILQMSDEEILTMKKNAYIFAQQNFDISVYVDEMKKFIESCV